MFSLENNEIMPKIAFEIYPSHDPLHIAKNLAKIVSYNFEDSSSSIFNSVSLVRILL